MDLLRSNLDFRYLFASQFLGAFNDNFYKNAMIMLITFKLSDTAEQTGLLITLAAGLFILPFFIFSSLAGQLADRYPKTELIKKVKLAEVLVMLLGAMALLSQHLELLYIVLFLMGTQSAFFGPLKYSILPEVLESNDLMKGNAFFSGSTFIAILLGTIFGGVGILMDDGTEIMAVSIIVVALLGYVVSLFISPTISHNPKLPIELNIFKSTWQTMGLCRHYSTPFFAVLAISWFWFLGAVFLSQIPTLVKYDLMADDSVVVLFLSAFSIGIALGSWLINAFLKGRISFNFHGHFLAAISILLVLIVALISFSAELDSGRTELITLANVVTLWPLNIVVVLLCLIAALGGAYIVPLYTLLQSRTPIELRARMIATNNVVNALLMVLSSILVMIGFALSMSLLQILMALALLNLLVAVFVYYQQSKLDLSKKEEQ